MRHIEKIVLENFQSHKKSIIEFNNELNVIVGPSDSGKTSILRGIKWALYNEPSGDYFIRQGQHHCSVTIIFNDLTKIKRYRSKSENSYYLYDSNNNEMKFEGFGTTVPEEIINHTGIKKILLDQTHSNTINLSEQLDGAFLLSESGSTRANSIGRLVGVNIIDDSLRDTLRDIRNLSNNKKQLEKNILELKEELKEYDYLKKLKGSVNTLESIKNKIHTKQKLQTKYKDIIQHVSIITRNKKQLHNEIVEFKDISEVDGIVKLIEFNLTRYNRLIYYKTQLDTLNKEKNASNKIVHTFKDLDIAEKQMKDIQNKLNTKIHIIKLNSILKTNLAEGNNLQFMLAELQGVKELQSLILKIEDIKNNIIQVRKLNNIFLSLTKSIALGKKYLQNLCYINQVADKLAILETKISLLDKFSQLLTNYNNNNKELKDYKVYLTKLKQSFNTNLNKYNELLLKQEVCPFCFSKIDNKKIKNIIENYK